MPVSCAHSTWPASSWLLVNESRRCSTACTSMLWSPTMLFTPGMCRAASSTSIGRSSALLGMQAQYEHSPPSSSCSTITAVRSLPWIAYWAAISPGGPPPITMTS